MITLRPRPVSDRVDAIVALIDSVIPEPEFKCEVHECGCEAVARWGTTFLCRRHAHTQCQDWQMLADFEFLPGHVPSEAGLKTIW